MSPRGLGFAGLALAAVWATVAAAAEAQTVGARPAASPGVAARVEPREVTVGDRVRVELDVQLPAGIDGPPALPPGLQRWGTAEVLAAGEPQKLPGSSHYRIHLVLTAFRPGDVSLPPLSLTVPVAAPGVADPATATAGGPMRLVTPEGLGFTVRSVLPADAAATPLPPAPPRALPAGELYWWVTGGLVAAAVLAAALLAWRLRRLEATAAGTTTPALAPLPALLRELAQLRREGSPERVHTGLSLALRRFVGGVLGFAAAERTTTEIDRELRRGPLETATRRELVELLRRCDEVKFARRPTTAVEGAERLDTAALLAHRVERELAPPPPTAEETAA